MPDVQSMENPNPDTETGNNTRLMQETRQLAIFGWIVMLGFFLLSGISWEWRQAGQWFIQSSLLWCYVLHQVKRRLHLNRPQSGAELFDSLGWANRLTILRGALIAMTGGFLFQAWPMGPIAWLPAIFYTIASMIDRLDGYIARKTAHTTQLGTELDTVFDAMGLVIAPALAVWYQQVHWSYLLVSCAYYLFQWGIAFRNRHHMQLLPLQPQLSRRAVAGFQMGFISAVLYPVFKPPVTLIAGIAFMIPLLTGFLIDWFKVTGKISASAPLPSKLTANMEMVAHSFIKPGFRLAITITLLNMLDKSSQTILFAGQDPLQHPLMITALCMTLAMIFLGILSRLAAVLLSCLLGWYFLYHALLITDYILLFSTIWLMLSGSGRFSLWQWDDHWVNRYGGA